MDYKLDRVSGIYEEIKSMVEQTVSTTAFETKILIDFRKQRKKGFYIVTFSRQGQEPFYETQQLNTKESFELADKLSFELWEKYEMVSEGKITRYQWSIGDLADLSRNYRTNYLGLGNRKTPLTRIRIPPRTPFGRITPLLVAV